MTHPKHFMDNRPVLTNPNYVPDKEYAKQRRTRMQDSIDDYLQDETISPRGVYEEMLSCIDDVILYHKGKMDRAQELRSLMHGYKTTDGDLLNELRKTIPSRY